MTVYLVHLRYEQDGIFLDEETRIFTKSEDAARFEESIRADMWKEFRLHPVVAVYKTVDINDGPVSYAL